MTVEGFIMTTRDNAAASDEDQMTPDLGKMAGGTNKGPTAAATADTQGAFGDAEQEVIGDPVEAETPVFDQVGPKDR